MILHLYPFKNPQILIVILTNRTKFMQKIEIQKKSVILCFLKYSNIGR